MTIKHLIRSVPVMNKNQTRVYWKGNASANLGKAEVDSGAGVLEGGLLDGFSQDTRSTEVSLHTNKSVFHTPTYKMLRYSLPLWS